MSKVIKFSEIKEKIIYKNGTIIKCENYNGGNSKITIKCINNHIWTTRCVNILYNKWCKECYYDKIHNKNINDINIIINKFNATIINVIFGKNENIIIKCKNDHQFNTKISYLKQGIWCKKCKYKEAHELVIKKLTNHNCELISEYVNVNEKIICKCNSGHIFSILPQGLENKHLCQECRFINYYNNKQKLLLNKIIKNNGKLLSEYKNQTTEVKIECKIGHIFFDTPCNIFKYDNRFCEKCELKYKSEELCREYFQSMFLNSFIKQRMPNILSNKNYPLELDGYCEKLNMAFEHQGLQHYKDIYNNPKKFKLLQLNDKLKIKKCKELGINLFIIPALGDKLDPNSLRQFILDNCKYKNIICPNPNAIINFNKFVEKENYLEICKKYAEKRGGKCNSIKILYSKDKVDFECLHNHKWSIAYYSIINSNSWCKECEFIKQKSNINNAIDIGYKNNLRCFSISCNGCHDILKWKCNLCEYMFDESTCRLQRYVIPCPNCKELSKTGRRNKNKNKIVKIIFKTALENADN